MLKTIIVILIVAAAVFPISAGLMTSTADIVVTNLRIGETFNLTELANMPFQVRGTDIEYRVKVTVLKPAPGSVTAGFEPIPDETWISLSRTEFLLLPGETGLSDITIRIPNDESLLGKKFEAKIHAVTLPPEQEQGAVGFGLGVIGSLRFSIAPRAPTEEEKEKLRRARYKTVNLSLVPNDLFLDDIPSGKKVNVERTTGKSLRIVNVGDEPAMVTLRCIPVAETGIVLPEGWKAATDTGQLTFEKKEVMVSPVSIKKINFFLRFPGSNEYRGEKLVFIVDATTKGGPVTTSFRSKVYISTMK